MLKYKVPLMSRPSASADIFQAIADPTRRAILARLRDGEQPVKQWRNRQCLLIYPLLKKRR